MIRIQHILQEFLRNVYRNPGTTFSGFLSMALLFLLFDLFWVAAQTSDRFYSDLISDLQMEVFVAEGTADSTLPSIREVISTVEGITAVEYVSRNDAREELTALVGVDLLVGYDTLNPLPRSYLVSFASDFLTIDGLSAAEQKIVSIKGVSHVYYSRNWLEKAEKTKGVLLNVGMILGGIILLTVLISSANNMRLMTRARAVGFHQMRLQGAGGLFLAFPFLIEGLILAGLSAVAGWLALYYASGKIEFTQFEIVLPTPDEILVFCALAGLLGIASAYVGIKRFLRL